MLELLRDSMGTDDDGHARSCFTAVIIPCIYLSMNEAPRRMLTAKFSRIANHSQKLKSPKYIMNKSLLSSGIREHVSKTLSKLCLKLF